MKLLHHAIRILTGLLLLATAASKFGFLPTAAHSEHMFTPEGWLFISAINSNGYLFPTIGIVSLVCGVAFLANRYVALAAVILTPVTLNFVLFHVFTDPYPITQRGSPAYIFFALNVYMLYSERVRYSAILKP